MSRKSSQGGEHLLSCAIRCKREINVDDRYRVSNVYGGPEYEAIAGFGSNWGWRYSSRCQGQ
jgi:aldehyde:ferredoxin oxidoreductase